MAKAKTKRPLRQNSRNRNTLVAELSGYLRKYVVMSSAQTLLVALWVIHTHCMKAVEQTPYLTVTSPEPQCGKSRLIDATRLLCPRPWVAITPSEAVVYRKIDSDAPTLFLDEIDLIFNPRSADRHEHLRALLNAGHRRGSTVPRCIGSSNKVVNFNTFCPKLLAGMGTLPDTIADRSVPIRLQRRKDDEKVARFFEREANPVATTLREEIEAWATDKTIARLRKARPQMPDELSDRMQEGCEILVATADELGCGDDARAALVEVFGTERLDQQESLRIRLLADVKSVFEQQDAKARKPLRQISTKTLLRRLCEIDDAPWRHYYGRRLEPRDLAALLRQYGIHSTLIRVPKKENPMKGYKRDDFYEPWKRYL
jgi:Protein of unknown function (DUF3631)